MMFWFLFVVQRPSLRQVCHILYVWSGTENVAAIVSGVCNNETKSAGICLTWTIVYLSLYGWYKAIEMVFYFVFFFN